MKILLNLAPENNKKWLKQSKLLAIIVRQALEALIFANRFYLRMHHLPPLYQCGIRYAEEPAGQPYEDFAAVPVVLARKCGDCFPVGTLLLRNDYSLVPIESLEPGMRVWGYDRWSSVEGVAAKGELSLDAITMSNGSTTLLTSDHQVYVRTCPIHSFSWMKRAACRNDGTICDCATTVKKRVCELQSHDMLIYPNSIPYGVVEQDPDRAWIDGVYLSDGLSDYDRGRFSISGQDGSPKETQKKRVQSICERLGIHTKWYRKSIALHDPEWTIRTRAMGRYAPEKEALTIGLQKESTEQLLLGIMADSGASGGGKTGRCLTTTSRMLGIQARVMHRMAGVTMSYRYVVNHGGLGENPIHRYSTRETDRKQLRVRSIERAVMTRPCYDIQTDDHYVYLPEHDVTVSNCDDLVSWRIAELRNAGENAKVRLKWQYDISRGSRMYHVLVRRADGTVEDPSLRLGMGTHTPASRTSGRMTP